ncbi:radical SAM domain protein [Halalkaliarchaeum desulfuricum]|uniref:Radical SAM domain protein n=1 Tax=Halalkaliarchaeum desulfuricum TaxID=2055893 RepID=A0A343TKM8_9EURY|nr:radical SAM protein [Halalkaliarchaeum desulfuricum]AUX09650.1 radical SAM domain protein [Halalkaliarchaeum desulfuricum]
MTSIRHRSTDLEGKRSSTTGIEDPLALASDLAPDADRHLKVTDSMCPECVAEGQYGEMTVPMVVYEEDGEIRLAKECEDHGTVRDVYWSDAHMYYRAREWAEFDDHLDSQHVTPDDGVSCPTDCGLCPLHKSHTGLGNITVSNRCDLSCWYCFFYAREDDPIYEPTIDQIREMVRSMTSEEPIGTNAIQITGGEPTLRDDIVEVVEAVAEEVDHIQLNTHSGRLAGNVDLARDLRDAGVNTIYTSFDGVSPETNVKNYWEMPEAIRTYREADLPVVLVPTLIGGYNIAEVGEILRFAAANSETIRGVNFQPVSLVGRMPDHERHEQRMTIPDAIHAIEEGTDGQIPADAWYPIPSVLPVSEFAKTWNDAPLYELSNHFACGMATYVYEDGDSLVPITDFFEVGPFLQALREIADAYEEPLSRFERSRVGARLAWELYQAVDRGAQPENVQIGKWLLEALTAGTYEGLVEFHENSLFLGMMHFMDPYNYDVDRVQRCDVHYGMPDGRVVPFCAYNVIPDLYRDTTQEEYAVTAEEWADREYATLTDSDAPDRTRLRSEMVTGREEDEEFLREGPGIYGYDVKRRRRIDEDDQSRIRETYRRAIEDLEPV